MAAPFLDVLYGALLGVLIVEFPLEHISDRGFSTTAIFFVVYFSLLAKLLLHWWAVRHDMAVLPGPVEGVARAGEYLLAVFIGFLYAVLIRLLCRWVTSPDGSAQFFRAFVLLYLLFRLGDIGIHFLVIPRMAKARFDKHIPPNGQAPLIVEWYMHTQRRIILIYLFGCAFLAGALVLPYPTGILMLVPTVVVELVVEYRLNSGRDACTGDDEAAKIGKM